MDTAIHASPAATRSRARAITERCDRDERVIGNGPAVIMALVGVRQVRAVVPPGRRFTRHTGMAPTAWLVAYVARLATTSIR